MESSFHQPVLRSEVLQWLVTDPSGTYCDGTVGGGGHAAAILDRLDDSGILIGIDRDPEAVEHCKKRFRDRSNVVIVHGSFAEADHLLAPLVSKSFAGVLLDLGVSSYQLDTPHRGFSHRLSGPLDMRMNPSGGITAAEFLNELSEARIADLLRTYGEERRASGIARSLIRFRNRRPISTTQDLVEVVRSATPPNYRTKSLSRVFQAVRIALNGELVNLAEGLDILLKMLAPGGRLVAVSYHSLEDRVVKTVFRDHSTPLVPPPGIPDTVVRQSPELKILTRHVVRPSDQECILNPRARSARLRAAEKIRP